jgi:hypothetical protein
MPTTNGMDTAGARELAKRIAEEERRRAEAAGEEPAGSGHDDASRDPDLEGVVFAVERLQGEAASLKVELAARDDAIARLRTELGELRAKMAADDGRTSEQPRNDGPTDHLLFVSQPSSYGLFRRDGGVPEVGSEVALSDGAEGRYRVCKVGPSPLPGDRRRCAFLERIA